MPSCSRTTLCCLLLATGLVSGGCAKPAPTPATAPELSEQQLKHSERLCAAGAWDPGTPAHCECMSGYVRGAVDGTLACPSGETELERIHQGVETAVCCAVPKH